MCLLYGQFSPTRKKIRSLSLFLGTVLPHLELQLSIVFLPGEDEVPLDAGLVLPGEHVLLLLGDGHVVPVVGGQG